MIFILPFLLFNLVLSTPIEKGNQFIDYNPPVTYPKGGESFIAGGNASISWNQTVPTVLANNTQFAQTAKVLLGYKLPNSTSDEHLFITLLEDVPLYAPAPNTAYFTLPKTLETRSTYILALIGSSGDISKEFTIVSRSKPREVIPADSPQESAGPVPFLSQLIGIITGLGGVLKKRVSIVKDEY